MNLWLASRALAQAVAWRDRELDPERHAVAQRHVGELAMALRRIERDTSADDTRAGQPVGDGGRKRLIRIPLSGMPDA